MLYFLTLVFALSPVWAAEEKPRLTMGMAAPAFSSQISWIQGSPHRAFSRGKTYVLHFWQTDSESNALEVASINELKQAYQDRDSLVVLSIAASEKGSAPERIRAVSRFLQAPSEPKPQYVVGVATDQGKMEADWIFAAGAITAPVTFIIDETGRIAFIGIAAKARSALEEILNRTWDRTKAIAAHQQLFNRVIEDLCEKMAAAFESAQTDEVLRIAQLGLRIAPNYAPFVEAIAETSSTETACVTSLEATNKPVHARRFKKRST